MLRPKALRTGDLVAVVATSGGLEKDEAPLLERGVGVLEGMGFVVRVSPFVDLERSWWWAAAPPAEVAEDLKRHLRDPKVRAIFSLTGGRVALSYLDLIDVVPESGVEPQHEFLEPAETDRVNRLLVRIGQRWVESHCAAFQHTERNGDDHLLRAPLPIGGVHHHMVGAAQRDAADRGAQPHRQTLGKPLGQLAIAAGEHPLRPGE